MFKEEDLESTGDVEDKQQPSIPSQGGRGLVVDDSDIDFRTESSGESEPELEVDVAVADVDELRDQVKTISVGDAYHSLQTHKLKALSPVRSEPTVVTKELTLIEHSPTRNHLRDVDEMEIDGESDRASPVFPKRKLDCESIISREVAMLTKLPSYLETCCSSSVTIRAD